MALLAAINHWLHLMSVILWVGGLGFLLMVGTPALREQPQHEIRDEIRMRFHRRFQRLVGPLVVTLLITGGLNVFFVHEELKSFTRAWMMFLGVKLALVTGLISAYLLHLMHKPPEDQKTLAEIPWLRPSFILGLLIVLMAAYLRHSHQ
jgi:putative copper export protein